MCGLIHSLWLGVVVVLGRGGVDVGVGWVLVVMDQKILDLELDEKLLIEFLMLQDYSQFGYLIN